MREELRLGEGMLEQLKLSNLALSNQAEVDFTPGMICITGETGAGKSLVVDALSLVLGAKADSNLVRQGQKQMEVSALFSIEHNQQAHKLLEAYGFVEEKPKRAPRTITQSAATSQSLATSSSNLSANSVSTASSVVVASVALPQETIKRLPDHVDSVKSLPITLSATSESLSFNSASDNGGVLDSNVALESNVATKSSLGIEGSVDSSASLSPEEQLLAQNAIVADGQAVGMPLDKTQDSSDCSLDSAGALSIAADTQNESFVVNEVIDPVSGFTTAHTGSTIITSTGDMALHFAGQSELSASTLTSASASASTSFATSTHAQEDTLVKLSESEEEESLDDEDNELIIRRVVSAEGKSKAYINGHMATLSQLREISECLVAIHGQHASVRLMDEKHQLEIVDNFGKLKPLVVKVNQAFAKYSAARQNLTQLAEEQKLGAQAYKQDRHELEELKRLDLKEGDYEELEAAFDKAMHQAQFMYAVTNLYNLIEGSESNIVGLLRDRLSDLDKVKAYDPMIVPLMEGIDTAIMNLYECSAQAEDLMSQDMELSSAELEAKMSKVHELARRFACAPKDLYLMSESLEQKVEQFLSLKDKINDLTQEVKDLRQSYEDLCQELTLKRQETAKLLAVQICERVKGLALPDARFDIVLTRDDACRPRLNGRDDLCFMFSANLGQELRPLSAVASGGELSRLALIIEVLTASVKSTPTLIFDEVDTGISGRTASAVGSLLKELGQYVQVITVTHLPQVAAKAHTQFVVAKYNEDGQVNSTISLLDNEGRVEEISRMIGGSVITDTTRKSAYELLNDL